jgi:GAF domain-containing protein
MTTGGRRGLIGYSGCEWSPVVAPDESIVRAALRDRTPVSAARVLRDGLFGYRGGVGGLAETGTDRAVLVVPLACRQELVGLVATADRCGRMFLDSEVARAQVFADQAAVALAEMGFLPQVPGRIAEAMVALLGARSAAVYRFDAESGTLVLLAAS